MCGVLLGVIDVIPIHNLLKIKYRSGVIYRIKFVPVPLALLFYVREPLRNICMGVRYVVWRFTYETSRVIYEIYVAIIRVKRYENTSADDRTTLRNIVWSFKSIWLCRRTYGIRGGIYIYIYFDAHNSRLILLVYSKLGGRTFKTWSTDRNSERPIIVRIIGAHGLLRIDRRGVHCLDWWKPNRRFVF